MKFPELSIGQEFEFGSGAIYRWQKVSETHARRLYLLKGTPLPMSVTEPEVWDGIWLKKELKTFDKEEEAIP